MDIALETIDVWQFEGSTLAPKHFLKAVSSLLAEGDIAVFGAYEPPKELISALEGIGAKRHRHIQSLQTCFDLNRAEHPHGCAFEFPIRNSVFSNVISLPDSILRQTDVASFYDHFIAYRPGQPQLPLISFHDASCGGTLYLSGLYSESEADDFATQLGGTFIRVGNPVIAYRNTVEQGAAANP